MDNYTIFKMFFQLFENIFRKSYQNLKNRVIICWENILISICW